MSHEKDISFYFSKEAYENKNVVSIITAHMRQILPNEALDLYIHRSYNDDILVGMIFVNSKVWPKVV